LKNPFFLSASCWEPGPYLYYFFLFMGTWVPRLLSIKRFNTPTEFFFPPQPKPLSLIDLLSFLFPLELREIVLFSLFLEPPPSLLYVFFDIIFNLWRMCPLLCLSLGVYGTFPGRPFLVSFNLPFLFSHCHEKSPQPVCSPGATPPYNSGWCCT